MEARTEGSSAPTCQSDGLAVPWTRDRPIRPSKAAAGRSRGNSGSAGAGDVCRSQVGCGRPGRKFCPRFGGKQKLSRCQWPEMSPDLGKTRLDVDPGSLTPEVGFGEDLVKRPSRCPDFWTERGWALLRSRPKAREVLFSLEVASDTPMSQFVSCRSSYRGCRRRLDMPLSRFW